MSQPNKGMTKVELGECANMSLVLEEWQITERKTKMLEPQNHTGSLTDQTSSGKRRGDEQEGEEKGS